LVGQRIREPPDMRGRKVLAAFVSLDVQWGLHVAGADVFLRFGLKRGLRSADRTQRGADRGNDCPSGRDRDERAEEAGAEELLTNPGQR